jgi:hypothetical protein
MTKLPPVFRGLQISNLGLNFERFFSVSRCAKEKLDEPYTKGKLNRRLLSIK